MAEVLSVPELIERLTALDRLHGAEREQEGRRLVPVARATVSAQADQGAWEMTRPRGELTRREAAALLGCAVSAVGDAVSRHNARLRQVRPVDRKADRKRG
jgi:hypothetical protein